MNDGRILVDSTTGSAAIRKLASPHTRPRPYLPHIHALVCCFGEEKVTVVAEKGRCAAAQHSPSHTCHTYPIIVVTDRVEVIGLIAEHSIAESPGSS